MPNCFLLLPLQIWNHPDVLYEALQKENLANEQDLDVDDLGTANTNSRCQPQGIKVKTESNTLASPVGEATNSKFLQSVGFNPFQERANQVVTYEWVSTTAVKLFIWRISAKHRLDTCSERWCPFLLGQFLKLSREKALLFKSWGFLLRFLYHRVS